MELRHNLKQRFTDKTLEVFRDQPQLNKRVEALYPLFGLKWCLILLNEFVPEDLRRRRFASQNAFDEDNLRAEQLDKARRMFHRIKAEYEGFPYHA